MKSGKEKLRAAQQGVRLLTAAAAISIASCGGVDAGSGSKPEGQVVASIGDEEVTQRELNMELQGLAASTSPESTRAAQNAALSALINRKILASAAREKGVDDRPEFQLARQRAEELLLAQALQRDIALRVPRPTREEAEQFISQHPNSFAQRKIFVLDQIHFSRNIGASVIKALERARTMQDVERILLQNGIEHRRVPDSIDAKSAPPKLVEQIVRLPENSVFIVPNNNTFVANQIRETRVIPFTGEEAIQQAQQILLKQRVDQALNKEGEQIRKSAGTIQYKQGYEPSTPGTSQKATGAQSGTGPQNSASVS